MGYYNKFDSVESLGYIIDISKCHGVGVWSIDYNILRFMFKNISPIRLPALNPPLVRDGPLGVPAFLKLAYWLILFISIQL